MKYSNFLDIILIMLIVIMKSRYLPFCHPFKQVWIFYVILDRIGDRVVSLWGIFAPILVHQLLLPLLLHQAL